MIELIQFPWSPFCIVQRRILEFSRVDFKITNIPSSDRSAVWELTRRRYYQVPVLKDGETVIFETGDDSQVIAKYLNERLQLDLFPPAWRGVQSILWRYIEDQVEGTAFRLNDVYWEEFVPEPDRLGFLRHKERRFGRGCIDQWRSRQPQLLAELTACLVPFEQQLLHHSHLLDDEPRFVDFDLYGMLGNFLYSGHYDLPPEHVRIQAWFERMTGLQSPIGREKLYT